MLSLTIVSAQHNRKYPLEWEWCTKLQGKWNLYVKHSNEGVVHHSPGDGAITTLWNGALVLMAHVNVSLFSDVPEK